MVSLALLALLGAAAPAPGGPGAPASFTAADAGPLFGGAQAAAIAALAAGRPAEALPALEASPAPEARYLEALALLGAGRADEAAARLDGLEAQLPVLADRIAWLLGRALEAGGRPAEAVLVWQRIGPGSLLRGDAALARSRLLAASGDPRAALEALAPILGLSAPEDLSRADVGAEALLAAGRIEAGGGERELTQARSDLLQCWVAHPLAPAAPRCREALRALPGRFADPPPLEGALRRAETLLDANRNRAAVAELKAIEAALPADVPASPEACRVRLALGRAWRKEHKYRKAIDMLEPALAACPAAPDRVKALHAIASASAVVEPDKAVDRYLQLAREFPDSPVADDALYFAADLLARAGDAAGAQRLLAEIVERYPRGDYRPEALFRSAWISWRAGDAAAALASLERCQREYEATDPYEFARAAYWRARILAQRKAKGDRAAALALWRMLVERHPADYYGLLARARLAELAPRSPEARWSRPPPPPPGFRYDPGRLRGDPHFEEGLLLLRMGQDRAAAEELRAVDRSRLFPIEPAGFDPLLLVAELLHRAGDHQAGHNLVRAVARQVLRRRPEGKALRIWRIAYPAAFRDEVERWAPGAGVPTDLLQAIMREESALDPAAVSAAGAVGLTQLMVPTAQALARRLKLHRTLQAADLMDGPLNIRLGAQHLGDVLRRFGASAPLAVAAYNVGEGAVRGWLRERGTLPLDEFIEEIPVQETRGYVKRVLRSYAAYRLLYGGPGELPLPLAQRLPALR